MGKILSWLNHEDPILVCLKYCGYCLLLLLTFSIFAEQIEDHVGLINYIHVRIWHLIILFLQFGFVSMFTLKEGNKKKRITFVVTLLYTLFMTYRVVTFYEESIFGMGMPFIMFMTFSQLCYQLVLMILLHIFNHSKNEDLMLPTIILVSLFFSAITINYRHNEILILYMVIATTPVYFNVFLLYFTRKCLIT